MLPAPNAGGITVRTAHPERRRQQAATGRPTDGLSQALAFAPEAGAPPKGGGPWSVGLVLDLVLCGALMAGIGLWCRYRQPDLPNGVLYVGLVGSAVCVLCAFLGRLGRPAGPRWRWRCSQVGRWLSALTLATGAGVFAVLAWRSWAAAETQGSEYRIAATLMAVVVAVCLSTLANLRRGRPKPEGNSDEAAGRMDGHD